jgi:hypothetical protein
LENPCVPELVTHGGRCQETEEKGGEIQVHRMQFIRNLERKACVGQQQDRRILTHETESWGFCANLDNGYAWASSESINLSSLG